MDLPAPVARAVAPLFEALPPEQALRELVVTETAAADLVGVVETVLRDEALPADGPLASALWLYVDELDRSHRVSQGIEDATGSFWHGIMHRREGDFSNSHYWFGKVGEHAAIGQIDGYEPHKMIDEVEALHSAGSDHLIDLQRREWQTLFTWSATEYA